MCAFDKRSSIHISGNISPIAGWNVFPLSLVITNAKLYEIAFTF